MSVFARPSYLIGTQRTTQRPPTKDGEKQAIWIPMLNSASKGKDLTQKQLLVLGGTSDQQRQFLESLDPASTRHRYGVDRRQGRQIPISNKYALGYTYQDVLDTDQDDILARLNIYMLSSTSSSLVTLLRTLLTQENVKDTLVTILLDWGDPFRWPRQLRQWIRLLRSVIMSLDDEVKIQMEQTMTAWKEKRVGPNAPNSVSGGLQEDRLLSILPLGPGEWDEGLGLPLSVVCINTEKMERLEREYGWQEDQFDFLMQWMRTILLKHGASMIYITNYEHNHVRILIHSSLGINPLLKREVVKPNHIDREKILIPSNWDSWGKIRVLKEDFNPEAVSQAWSLEIQSPPEQTITYLHAGSTSDADDQSAVALFESALPDHANEQSNYKPIFDTDAPVTVPNLQTFLIQQAAILEQLKAEDEKADRRARKGAPAPTGTGHAEVDDGEEQSGPYQINVNGIDFDAEEATRRIREREADRTRHADNQRGAGVSTPQRDKGEGGQAGKPSNEALYSFFDNLIKKGKGPGSGTVSPARGSPAGRERSRG